MRQGGALGIPRILQQAPGRRQGGVQVFAPEPRQVLDLKLLG